MLLSTNALLYMPYHVSKLDDGKVTTRIETRHKAPELKPRPQQYVTGRIFFKRGSAG